MTENDKYQYILSIAALVMSALAMIFAFMELRSSDKQFEANIWPYVDLDITVTSNRFEVTASNKGMGPALIHEFRIRHEGELVTLPSDLLERSEHQGGGEISLSSSTVAPSVMSTGERVSAIRVEGPETGTSISAIIQELEIELCYCAINGTCWNNGGESPFRTQVAACNSQEDDLEDRLQSFTRPGDETDRETE